MTTKLTLHGTVNFEKEDISSFLAAKIIALVEQETSAPEHGNSNFTSNFIEAPADNKTQLFAGRGLIEAFSTTSAKTNMQKIAVAGQRAIEESGGEVFSAKDIVEQFRSGGVSSKNLARDLRKAVSQGLIYAVTGKKGQYKVTEIAENAFKNGFSQVKLTPRRVTSGRKARKGSGAQKVEVSDAVKNLPIQVSMEGYADYHNYKMKSERIIWLLTFADNSGINELNTKEIEHLSRAVSDQISSSSVPALTASSIKKGLVAKMENRYRVLHKGKLYLGGGKGDQA